MTAESSITRHVVDAAVRVINFIPDTMKVHHVRNPMRWLTPPPDERSVLLQLPPYRQTDFYSCGFVAGLIVVRYFNPHHSAQAFFDRVGPDHEVGTSQSRLLRALRQTGIKIAMRDDLDFEAVASTIDAGRPIIVTVRRSKDMDHWVVIGGYGRKPNRVYLWSEAWLTTPTCYRWKDFRTKWSPAGLGLICWPKRSSKRRRAKPASP